LAFQNSATSRYNASFTASLPSGNARVMLDTRALRRRCAAEKVERRVFVCEARRPEQHPLPVLNRCREIIVRRDLRDVSDLIGREHHG
jgi:hypothetical protein